MSTKTNYANKQAKKALKWIILSGVAVTFLTGLQAYLEALQTGELNPSGFITAVSFLSINGLINVLLFWISQYKQA